MSTRTPSDAVFYTALVVMLGAAFVVIPILLLGYITTGEPVEIGTAVSIERPTCEET
jgi:hypothetical protein